MDKIQELRKRHSNLKMLIKNHMKRGTDCKKYVEEYLKIVNKLRVGYGVYVNDSSPLLTEAVSLYGGKVLKSSPVIPESIPAASIPATTLETKKQVYKITLAWTERPEKKPDNTIQIIENYICENGATILDASSTDFGDYKENMRTYEWKGGDKEFAILRRSANYILDVFAETQYEKFNISIFGNKRVQ
jgi:hypothetical protein